MIAAKLKLRTERSEVEPVGPGGLSHWIVPEFLFKVIREFTHQDGLQEDWHSSRRSEPEA
jgi:hypothetical protein